MPTTRATRSARFLLDGVISPGASRSACTDALSTDALPSVASSASPSRPGGAQRGASDPRERGDDDPRYALGPLQAGGGRRPGVQRGLDPRADDVRERRRESPRGARPRARRRSGSAGRARARSTGRSRSRAQAGRPATAPQIEGGDRSVDSSAHVCANVARFERRAPHEHLVDNRAERPDVGAGVDLGRREDLLGRHVLRRAEDDARLRCPRRSVLGDVPLRDPEVEDLDEVRAVGAPGDEEVRRLEVAMHDAARVRLGDALAGLHGVVDGHVRGQRGHGREIVARRSLPSRYSITM